MPVMTIDSIRDNPWNAVKEDIPANPSSYLLYVAFRAVTYCRASEYEFMLEARAGIYTPFAWELGGCDGHAIIEPRFLEASDRASELQTLHARLFGNAEAEC